MDIQNYKDAVKALQCAQNHFENAEPLFVDAAIYELRAAESRVDALKIAVERGLS